MVKNISTNFKKYLQADVSRLTGELSKARQLVVSLKDKEESLKELLLQERKRRKDSGVSVTSTSAIKTNSNSSNNNNNSNTLSSSDKRPAALVRKYGELYAQTR